MSVEISAEAKAELLQQLNSCSGSQSNIPQSVVQHAIEIVRSEMECSLLASLTEKPARTLRALDSLFRDAGAVVGLAGEKLVAAADWLPSDQDPNRFDAMIAELRTVVWLSGEGFSEIRLIGSRGKKGADATARRGVVAFAVEVTCVTGFKYPGHLRRGQELAQFFVDRYAEKRPQLEATAAGHDCQSRVLVCVFVEHGQKAMVTRKEYLEQGLAPAWCQLGSSLDTHLAVIAHPDDNCVFPPW